jgi:hypothetical protein
MSFALAASGRRSTCRKSEPEIIMCFRARDDPDIRCEPDRGQRELQHRSSPPAAIIRGRDGPFGPRYKGGVYRRFSGRSRCFPARCVSAGAIIPH